MTSTFPPELKLEIFKTSVRESRPMAPTLMCLSKDTHTIIARETYETLIVYNKRVSIDPDENTLQKYGNHVRHLLYGWGGEMRLLPLYLASCPNITHLALWWNFSPIEVWHQHLKKLPLTRLSVHLGSIHMAFDETENDKKNVTELFSHFPQLTHLDLLGDLPHGYVPCLKSLPNLQFLSCMHLFPTWSPPDLRESCPDLKAFVILQVDDESETYTEIEGDKGADPRVVRCPLNYTLDWTKGAEGQPDVYDWALGVLNKRSLVGTDDSV